ncbi:MobP3 family relaxase [Paenibacillus macerans]|uniref:MobP3 family relaxase n=1 Tax=Paenibacillus macerans TaxID=44252 RepID=UPI001F1049E7|nr:MobP3 family relaxase [Paenibacillus macerans]MEC0140495.1 MobP3 family relaxase [Paenibacillus macerans]UMV45352.1 relaxase MobL [Paenibacillus macerans]
MIAISLIYKQRFFHPNHPKTAVGNYVHIGYIATRPGAVRHENMSHGLFGKLKPGSLQTFDSWQEVARIARQISREGKNMYRSVISFRTETAFELGLTDFTDWQQYIEQHISTLAAHNQIKIENLCWAAAFHNERNHPHLHVVFWDKSQTIIKNFTHPEIPNRIRKQLIKDTFAYKIKEFCVQRDRFKNGITEVTDSIIEEFEAYMKRLNPRAFRALQHRFEQDDEDSLLRFPKHYLIEPASVKQWAKKLFELRRNIPKSGRLAYKLLPPETKLRVDAMVHDMLNDNRYLAQMVENYVQAKLKLAMLYDSHPDRLEKLSTGYRNEAEKRIANRILQTIRTMIQLEKEVKSSIREADRQYALAEQMLLELLTAAEGWMMRAELDYDDKAKVMGGDFSKLAKKEWLLQHKDRGMEW